MRRLFVFLAIVGGALCEGGNASATCCNTDADCPHGIACAGGACNATEIDCTCDTDCGPGLYCIPAVITECTGSNQNCHSVGRCGSGWQRPCATAADCGAGGFTCVANGQLCSSAGCQTTSMCMPPPLPSTCATDADCPAAWTCEPDTVLTTNCVSSVHGCPANGCPPPTGAKSCVPPLFDLVGTESYDGPPVVLPSSCPVKGGGDAGGAPYSSMGSGGAGGAPSAGTPAAGGAGGAPSGAGTPGIGGTGVPPAGATGTGGAGQAQHVSAGASSGSGCQMAPSGGAGSTLLLVCLGLMGLSPRRRPKR